MDKKTAEKLYDACYMRVYSYVMTLVKDQEKAQEITQDTFFKAMTAKKSFRGESECYTWLCAIAKNLFIDETRRSARYAVTCTPSQRRRGSRSSDAQMYTPRALSHRRGLLRYRH